MSRSLDEIVDPDPKSQERARVALEFLVKEKGARYEVRDFVIKGKSRTDRSLELPVEATRLLVRILTEFSKGNAVSVVPVNAELTTQEAAKVLNVSRPYLVSVLEAGKIPFRKVGSHRRVRLADLSRYKAVEDAKQEKALKGLAAEAQKLKLGY